MRRLVLLALAALVPVNGCASRHHEVVVARHCPGEVLPETAVPKRARYGLFVSGHPEGTLPLAVAELAKGQTLGFRPGPDGSIVAFAGDVQFGFPAEPCEWRLLPGTGSRLVAVADKAVSTVVDGTTTVAKWVFCGVLIVGGVVLIILVAVANSGGSSSGRSLFGFGK